MKHRRFGRLGWQVSEIGYGMWGMGDWSGSDDEQSMQALHRSVALGCNFFDTAFAYGDGRSEKLLGRLVRAHPDKRLYTASKIAPKNRQWPALAEHRLDDVFPPDYIRASIETTLQNLGQSSVDLIQLHVWTDEWATDERWQRALDDARREGLIGGVGISINRWEPANVLRALRTGVVDAVQVIYNIFDQNPEDQLFPMCAAHDVAVIARVPFDEGSLTGNLTKATTFPAEDWRASYFVRENLDASVDHAEALKPLLLEGMTMPEMALRFILGNETVSTVIPGMRTRAHVDANIGCSDAGPLPPQLTAKLRAHRWDRTPTAWSQ